MKTNAPPLRVLIVDDSALFRKVVRQVLEATPGIEVVGVAANGNIALAQIRTLKPDVVTLDFEMPQLDGIGVLRKLASLPSAPLAIMVSAFTTSGASATTLALQEGAFDFILKPASKSLEQSVAQLQRELTPKLQACSLRLASKRVATRATPEARSAPPTPARPVAPPRRRGPVVKPNIVGVAISTGGPQALTRLMPSLPANFPCPIVMVQHMPPMFTASLAADLNRRCKLEVLEGAEGMEVKKGRVILAPGGKQMRIVRDDSGVTTIAITNDPPERNCKPAADYLFRSIAQAHGGASLGVVLTGMGDDGTAGSQAIKDAGGTILAQDEESCVVYGMPKSVVDAGLADTVAPLASIPDLMTTAAEGRVLV